MARRLLFQVVISLTIDVGVITHIKHRIFCVSVRLSASPCIAGGRNKNPRSPAFFLASNAVFGSPIIAEVCTTLYSFMDFCESCWNFAGFFVILRLSIKVHSPCSRTHGVRIRILSPIGNTRSWQSNWPCQQFTVTIILSDLVQQINNEGRRNAVPHLFPVNLRQ